MIRSPADQLRHDLRTPLIVLTGYAEMVIEDLAAAAVTAPALVEELQGTYDAGQRVLAELDATPTPAGTGSAQAEALLAAAKPVLRTGLDDLMARCGALIEHSQALGLSAAVEDERVMRLQIESLRSRLAAERAPQPDSSPVPAAVGGGSTDRIEALVASGLPPSARATADSGRPLLVVDDHEINRHVLTRLLERLGHRCESAVDGLAALEMVRSGDYDLVLLDVMMPGMNGDDVLRELKADPRLRDLPVIMVSALDGIDTVVRCIELGAEDYLPKPFDPVLLRARVGASLEKKRLRDAEMDYLRDVERLTSAAAAVESGEFAEDTVAEVAGRGDELGRLARVFGHMVREVRAREQALRSEVRQLRIEIDERRTARQVAEITETEYFRDLQRRVDTLRLRVERSR